jgi:catalase-peroxidase
VPDAHDKSKRHAPMMLTTDLSLKVDPISSRSRSPQAGSLADALPRWFKRSTATWVPARYLGPVGPGAAAVAVSPPEHRLVSEGTSRPSSASPPVGHRPDFSTAWNTAASFHGTKAWRCNGTVLAPRRLGGSGRPAVKVLKTLEQIRRTSTAHPAARKFRLPI